MNGRPLSIPGVAAKVPAILEIWYAGQEGGTAVAEALFGDINPGGKLPITVPRTVGQLPVYYNRRPTSFRDYLVRVARAAVRLRPRPELHDVHAGRSQAGQHGIGTSGRTTMSVKVTNTGTRPGDEVVQMYVHDVVASVTRPVKQLRGFKRVSLKPGESTVVTLPIGPEGAVADRSAHGTEGRAGGVRDTGRDEFGDFAEGGADGEGSVSPYRWVHGAHGRLVLWTHGPMDLRTSRQFNRHRHPHASAHA